LYVLRLFSISLHCVTVLFTYLLARRLFGARSWAAYGAAFFVAIHPQYTYISAAYNNDALPPPLVAAALYAVLAGLDRAANPRWLGAALLAGGASLVAKRTAVGIVPVLGLGVLGYGTAWLRAGGKRWRYAGLAVVGAALLGFLAASAVLWFELPLPRGLATLLRFRPDTLANFVGLLRAPQSLPQIDWAFQGMLGLYSFWGYFGWFVEQVPPPWYAILGASMAVSAAGCVVGFARLLAGSQRAAGRRVAGFLALLVVGLAGTILSIVSLTLLAPAYYGAQGRYTFPFISAFAILGAWGWLAWWPRRWQGAGAVLGLALLVAFDVACWATMLSFFYV
jgi:4-amino-4-deoxy-L-arabinose transferase-like glycosyltransferase